MIDNKNKTIAYICIGVGAMVAILFVAALDNNMKEIFTILILLIAGALIYFIHAKGTPTSTISEKIIEKTTEKDYLKQIADDIHTIKVIVIAFAAIAIVTMLISVFSLLSLASAFSKF